MAKVTYEFWKKMRDKQNYTKRKRPKYIKFLDIGLDFSLAFLSYFVPKDPRKILFGSGGSSIFRGNPKYAYLYMWKNHLQFDVCWFTMNKKLYRRMRRMGYPVVSRYSFAGFWRILRSSYLVVETAGGPPADIAYCITSILGRFQVIQTWHGAPIKTIIQDKAIEKKGMRAYDRKITGLGFLDAPLYYLANLLLADLKWKKYRAVIATSGEVKRIMEQATSSSRVTVLGYPRNDVFFDKSLLFNDYRREFSLHEYSKVILYVPTFRDNYESVKPFGKEFVTRWNERLQERNSIFIIKKHPLDLTIEVPPGLTNIIYFSDEIGDVQELLVHADILVTDYSSVCFDFSLTDRPIIYYAYDYEEYLENCSGMYYDYFAELPGPFAKSEEELDRLIATADEWFADPDYQVKYRANKHKFNTYTDGRSCERLVEFLTGSK